MRDRFFLKDERGFTLIEVMFSTVLLSFLFITIWGIFNHSVSFWKQSEYKVDMNDSLQISLDRMGRELMFARRPDANYPDSGYPGGVLVNSSNTDLYFEIDGTPTVAEPNPPPKKILYYCSSNTLYRQENNYSSQPLASDIQSVVFTYYNSAGAVVSPASIAVSINSTNEQRLTSIENAKKIRQVKIVLTAKKQGTTINPATLVQKVSLRSL